jgi:hypothetical protein
MMALTGAVAMGGSKEATGDGSSTFARPEWQELEYVARKFLLKATATVSAAYPPVESVSLQPLPEAGDAIQPTGSSVVRVTMLSDLPFGQNEEVVTWLDGDSLAVLEATKLVTGRKHYRKLWRYRSAGYTRWRWEPEGSDDESDPDSWSDLDVKRVSVDAASSGSAPVTDSYALIWLISAARLDRDGATLRAELYADEQLETIELTAAERRPHTVKLTEVRGDETIERDNEIWVRRVVGRPADPGVDVGFFGMKGELTVLVEEGTGVPVEIEGTADGIGHLRVRLKRVVY